MLSEIPHVVAYLDDIILKGKKDKEHLEILAKTLKRLEEYGLRVHKEKCRYRKMHL